MNPPSFRGKIPDDRLYDPEHHVWVLPDDDDNTVLIGLTAYGVHLAGGITGFASKPRGTKIERGHDMATIESSKTGLAVPAPLGFTVIEGNEAAAESPELLNRDPYGEGWLVRVQPNNFGNEMGQLIDPKHYRRHIRRADPEAEFL